MAHEKQVISGYWYRLKKRYHTTPISQLKILKDHSELNGSR